MPIIRLTGEEWYPVWVPADRANHDAGDEASFTDEEMMEMRRVFREFAEIQRKLATKQGLESGAFIQDCEF